MDLRDVIKKRKTYEQQFAQQQVLFFGVIVESDGTIDVPNTPDHVHVQAEGSGDVVAVYNPGMKAGPGRGVVCGFEAFSTTLQILRFDERTTAGVVPVVHLNVPNHAETHLIDGEDPLVVYDNAIWVLLTYTLGLPGLVVNVSPHVYLFGGQVVVFPGQDNLSLAAHEPAGGLARFVLIYLDLLANALSTVAGATTVDSPIYTPAIPAIPANSRPSALVRIAGGQTIVQPEDIYSVRDFLGAAAGNSVIQVAQVQVAHDDASPISVIVPPANSRIVEVAVRVDTVFDATGVAIQIGVAGETDRYMAASDNIPGLSGIFEKKVLYSEDASPDEIIVTFTPGSGGSAGLATIFISFTT